MPTDGGPGPEWVVELLEMRVVMTAWVSRSCCRRKSPPLPPKAPPDRWLGFASFVAAQPGKSLRQGWLAG